MRVSTLIVTLGLLASASVAAQATGDPNDADSMVFELATSKIRNDRTQLINGTPNFQVKDWQTVVVAMLKQPADRLPEGRCTATLVGPAVLLLAAHCLDVGDANAVRSVFIKVDGIAVEMSCGIADAYFSGVPRSAPSPRRSEDYGLCYSKDAAKSFALKNMKFEQVATSAMGEDKAALMMGYGCTDLKKPEDQNSTLRLGDTKLALYPAGKGRDANYGLINSSKLEPALCPGDSGGPLFVGASIANPNGLRRVRGVNSSVTPEDSGYVSRIAMLDDAIFEKWAVQWIAKFPGAYICGLPDEKTEVKSCHN